MTDRIDFPPACTRNTATHERVLILHFIAGVFMQPIASLFSPFAAPPSASFYTIHGVSFFFLLATPAGIALFSPPFFRVANVDAIFPPAFFPPPSPPRSPCKSNRSWCVSFFSPLLSFFFSFLSSFSSSFYFTPLTLFIYSFIDGRSYLHSRVFL